MNMQLIQLNSQMPYKYRMLGRLQFDCESYLYGLAPGTHRLWAGNIDDQIKTMKSIYESLEVKPDWITMEQIEEYEKQMKRITK